MQIGEVIASGMTTRTPWTDRVADNGVFTYEVIGTTTAAPTLVVQVLHKNYEDTGNGAIVGGTQTWTEINSGSGFWTIDLSGLKEQVRFKIAASGGDGRAAIYRILPPTWYNTAHT